VSSIQSISLRSSGSGQSESSDGGAPAGLEAGYQKLKLVKRGHMALSEPLVCGLSFDSLPAWLWSFRFSDWAAILLTDTDERRLRQYHVSTWSFWRVKLIVVEPGEVATGLHNAVVWFASGSRSFLEPFGEQGEGIPVVTWLERGGRRRPADTLRKRWFSVAHALVGGSTTSRGVFGSCGVNLEIPVDPLLRTLAHVVKFSERPFPCSVPVSQAHYTLDQRLCLGLVTQPVLFESGFSRSGWGIRKLIPYELSQAFDLPPYLEWCETFPQTLIPIQMFRVVVDAALGCMRGKREEIEEPPRVKVCLNGSGASAGLALPDPPTWLPTLGLWLPGSWADAVIASKAVKADNADVDFRPWNLRVTLAFPVITAAALRGFELLCLLRWRQSLSRSFFTFLRAVYGRGWGDRLKAARQKRCLSGRKRARTEMKVMEHHDEGGSSDDQLIRDVSCGLQILNQVMRSDWWEWKGGSSLFFWRWNGAAQRVASRDGISVYVAAPLPTQRRQKPQAMDAARKLMVAEKIDGMMGRGYLEVGHVTNTVHFFAVPKGEDDIRVVFDGTSSGLNETLWAPNFFLPSAKSASMVLGFSSWMSDMDFGEMFHNFNLDPRIRPYSGVNVEKLGLSEGRLSSLRWTRLFMGMRPSPYNAVRHYYWGEEFARGNPADRSNPMGYDRIRINLPGMSTYDPSFPKVMKWRIVDLETEAGEIAGDVVTFIDEVRITGFSKENCHAVRRQFGSRIQYLGMQDAPRKFRPPSQKSAGAWTGTVFKVGSSLITKSVSQEKWERGRGIVEALLGIVNASEDGRPQLDRKQLEKETGFMNHLAMTFETISPFLKGLYLTLNSWRNGRDEGDWKVTPKRWKALLFAKLANGKISEEELDVELERVDCGEAPALVRACTGLREDLNSLSTLFGPSAVPEVSIRSKNVVTIVYGFGDASGSGLGATFTCGSGFNFRIGVWGAEEDPQSSNWKEFTNIVESLEEEAELGHLSNSEVFMFTDNSTVEACASKGSSSSPKLLDLVVRLFALTSKVGVKVNIFHVAGTRMIAQGTDGVSRGYLGQGVMAGDTMSVHIPIHLTAVERSPTDLVPWIRSWSGKETILLDEAGWFQEGHDIEGWIRDRDGFERPTLSSGRRTYLWVPAPLSAEVAIAELRKARIKRQDSSHVFVCPRLCTTQWVKHLYRAADIVFEVPIGFSCWPANMHEPLLIGILFPFLSVKPWQIRGTPKMYAVGRELRRVFKESEVDTRDLLRQFWLLCVDLERMPEHVVRKLLSFC
jgi:hypothetical protein